MAARTQRLYSKPWLERRFVLTGESIAWGRYVITGTGFHEIFKDKQDLTHISLLDADPGEIATAFERLLGIYQPETFRDFLVEVQAMTTYHNAKEQVKALAHAASNRADYDKAQAAMASAFEATLSAVIEATKRLHGLNGASFFRYRQILHGMHLAAFTDGREMYEAAFTPDLVLECINNDSDYSRVWSRHSNGDNDWDL